MSSAFEFLVAYNAGAYQATPDEARESTVLANAAYRQLTEAEIERFVIRAFELLRVAPDHLEPALNAIAVLRPWSLHPHLPRLIENGIFHPATMFFDADSKIASTLVPIVREGDVLAMYALAWTKESEADELVTQSATWEAGWERNHAGRRRWLAGKPGRPLITPLAGGDVHTVGVWKRRKDRCPFCDRNLVAILEHGGYTFPTCSVCGSFGTFFFRDGLWHPANTRPDYLPAIVDDETWIVLPEGALGLAGTSRPAIESADWLVPGIGFSQIGGYPTWIQQAEYPTCPNCNRSMPYYGQVSNEDYDPTLEGIEYAFLCDTCGVTATLYQQS